ncbi:RNA polymerase sigma factor [Thalassoglobus polymorphus]|uniref:ECF RNA polymerase sigma-E factor n=1 Tax=Thalassoglobus polymorphus TaxID=2527994 RepID=A0A517QVG8_9PLAN|nr:sigma-70 family RNA polymerase sigma factor [Thalassoglobus polymorphus]QDT35622.1 ECF RNA polymerase sigma-E factor [Thalassoglobus polymorphus]
MTSSVADRELIKRIRAGEEKAWQECIQRYEGRLQAFVQSRVGNRATAEDVVQDTFLGFLTALPNFDETKKIQSFLFAIAAHKLTDVLRRNGRRPTLPLNAGHSSQGDYDPVGRERVASSIARSVERKTGEEEVLADCLEGLIQQWMQNGEYERLKCIELLFVRGFPNKEVADLLNISEQAVANHKYFVVSKLKEAATQFSSSFDFDMFGIPSEP